MDAHKKRLGELFIDCKFKIPFYQRSYTWGKVEDGSMPMIERMIEDMEMIMDCLLNGRPHPYFFGAVILKRNNDTGIYDVVDGQQRLTTIQLWDKALSLYLHDEANFNRLHLDRNHQPLFIHNRHDIDDFNEIMLLPSLNTPIVGSGNVVTAYKAIVSYLSNLPEKYSYPLVQDALKELQLVVIEIDSSDDEQQIFDSINSLGVDLTTGELLKNYFFSNADIETYLNGWERVFDNSSNGDYWVKPITNGRLKDSNIERLVYAYLQVKIQDESLNIPREVKDLLRHRDGGIFQGYKKLEDYNVDKNVLRDELIKYAEYYHESLFRESELTDAVLSSYTLRNRRKRVALIMLATNSWTLLPYMLYIGLNKNIDDAERNRIYECLETYLMRRIICKKSNNNYSDLFSENLIGQHIHTYSDLMAYFTNKDASSSVAMPTDEELHEALLNNDLRKFAPLILFLLQAAKPTAQGLKGKFTKCQVVPLIPNKPSEEWPLGDMDEETRTLLCNRIGNYLLTTKKVTKSDGKKAWVDKRHVLQTAIDGLNSPIPQSFSVDMISIVCEHRYNDSIACWPISNQGQEIVEDSSHNEPNDETQNTSITPATVEIEAVPSVASCDTPTVNPNIEFPIRLDKNLLRKYSMVETEQNICRYENIYIDAKLELMEDLEDWFKDFIYNTNRNHSLRLTNFECVIDDPDWVCGYACLSSNNVLPFAAKCLRSYTSGTLYRIVIFEKINAEDFAGAYINFEDVIDVLEREEIMVQ